jgi:hypothetical protein
MTKILSLLFLCLFLVACKKSDDDKVANIKCASGIEAQEAGDCVVEAPPVIGTTTTTTGGTTTDGTTTGGTTTGGTTTGGTTTGGTTTGGTTTGGTTTGGTTTGTTTGGTTTNTGLPNGAYTFDINAKLVNFTATREAKVQKAFDLVKRIIATEKFRSRVLNHTYNGVKTFVDNNGLTNSQIYQRILEGAETLQPTKNNRMDVELETYYANNNVVGYTYANSKRIWMNTKFFDPYTIPSVSANLMHEWMHKLGFGHASTWSVARDHSVPYGIGKIINELGRELQ